MLEYRDDQLWLYWGSSLYGHLLTFKLTVSSAMHTCPFGVDGPFLAAFSVTPACVPCHLHGVHSVRLQVRNDRLVSVSIMCVMNQFLSHHFIFIIRLVEVDVISADYSVAATTLRWSPFHKHGCRVDRLSGNLNRFIRHCKVQFDFVNINSINCNTDVK